MVQGFPSLLRRILKPFSCNQVLQKQAGRRSQAVSIICGSGQPQAADHLQPADNQEGAEAGLLGSQSVTPQGTPRWLELLAVGSLVCSIIFGAIPAPLAQASTRLTADERETIELFKESTSSVVYITNLASRRDAFTLDMLAIPQVLQKCLLLRPGHSAHQRFDSVQKACTIGS